MARCLYIQGLEESSLGCLESALNLVNSLFDTNIPRPSLLLNTAFILIEKAKIYYSKGDANGEELLRESRSILEDLLAMVQSDKTFHRLAHYANNALQAISSINRL